MRQPKITQIFDIQLPPLALPLFSLGLGIAFHKTQPLYIAILVITIITATFVSRKQIGIPRKSTLLFLAVFLLGIALPTIHTKRQSSLLHQIANKNISLIATVQEKTNFPIPRYQELLHLNVEQVIKENETNNDSFSITCYIQQKTSVAVGDKILLKNIIIKTPSTSSSICNKTSFLDFLKKENILATVFTKEIDHDLVNRPAFSITRTLSSLKLSVCAALKKKLSKQAYDMFASIFLGNTKNNRTTDNERKHFSFWGLAHYLARSGLHISLFVFIWKIVLSFLPVAIVFRRTTLCLVCLVYFLLSWPSISFLRALGLFILFESGSILLKQTNVLHLLLCVACVVLVVNPFQLFFLDFQLSFALAGALAFIYQARKKQTVTAQTSS